MRKATLFFSIASFVTSAATLGVVAYGAKRIHEDLMATKAQANESLKKFKKTLLDIEL